MKMDMFKIDSAQKGLMVSAKLSSYKQRKLYPTQIGCEQFISNMSSSIRNSRLSMK